MNQELNDFTREVNIDSHSMIERTYSKEGTTVADSINKALTMVEKVNERIISQDKIYLDIYTDIVLANYIITDIETQIKELKDNKYKMTPNINTDLENILIKLRKIKFQSVLKEE